MVAIGNKALLHREQREVIPAFYDDMWSRPTTGPAMTYVITTIGAPSIPGAGTFADTFPITIARETPGPRRLDTAESLFGIDVPSVSTDNPLQFEVVVTTPFPDGNIADRYDRWRLIEADTLPAYQQLLTDDPERARDIVTSPISERITEERLHRRLHDIAGQLLDWDIEVNQ
jgi:hypothetical protein